MQVFLVLALIVVGRTISSGDFSVPTNYSTFVDGKIQWLFSIDQTSNTITMHAKFN